MKRLHYTPRIVCTSSTFDEVLQNAKESIAKLSDTEQKSLKEEFNSYSSLL